MKKYIQTRHVTMNLPLLNKILLFTLMAVIKIMNASADDGSQPRTLGETDIRPFTMSGRLGIQSEAYAVEGIESRRPPGMGMINLSTNFSILGFKSGFNVLYSTDDNQLRQSMNQVNFYGSWRWLTVSAGTVSPRYSRYSLNGIAVTGGSIEIAPSWFSVALSGGRTKRAVAFSTDAGFREPSFERWLYAGRIGFGRKDRNEFAITGLYASDKETSLENVTEILPTENLSITPQIVLTLFKERLQLESNVTLSAFTRDTTTDELDISDIELPGLITDIFQPHSSTRVDYAGEVSGRLNLGVFRLEGGYERVQPGFRSLGLGQIRSDQELIRGRTQFRLLKGRVNFSGNFSSGRNNLLNTRLSTLNRLQLGSNLMIRMGKTSNLMVSYMRLFNEISPSGDNPDVNVAELQQSQISQNFMITPSVVLIVNNFSHNISFSGSYQIMEDKSAIYEQNEQPSPGFTTLTAGVSYGITLPTGLSLNTTGNLMINDSEYNKALGQGVNVSTGYSFFDRKLTTNLSLGWSRNGSEFTRILEEGEEPGTMGATIQRMRQKIDGNNDFLEGEYIIRQYANQYTIGISTTYRLPNGNPLRFNLRGLSSNPSYEGGREFNEFHAVLRYEHRF